MSVCTMCVPVLCAPWVGCVCVCVYTMRVHHGWCVLCVCTMLCASWVVCMCVHHGWCACVYYVCAPWVVYMCVCYACAPCCVHRGWCVCVHREVCVCAHTVARLSTVSVISGEQQSESVEWEGVE